MCFNLPHVDIAEPRTGMQTLTLAPAASRDLVPVLAGKLRQRLVWLAAQHNVCIRLTQRRAGRGRAMRPDENSPSETSQLLDPRMWNTQLGLGTAPEQIRGRCWDDDEVWLERCEPACDISRLQRLDMRVNKLYIVSFTLQKLAGGEKLQRQMRIAAAEVG
jgi:hypothetical protein